MVSWGLSFSWVKRDWETNALLLHPFEYYEDNLLKQQLYSEMRSL